MTRLLTRDEYLATFTDPMRRLGDNERYSSVSIGEYVRECVKQLALVPVEELVVQDIYRSGNGDFFHALLNFGQRNVFLVIVVDSNRNVVHGHYVLDLNVEYGLNDDE